jgi:hypothetical protein
MLFSGKVIITCLPRVETSGLKSEAVSALTDSIHQSMETVFEATSSEVSLVAARSGRNTNCIYSSPSTPFACDKLVQ